MRSAALILLFLFAFSSWALPQEDTRSVHGVVRDQDGIPLKGAAVLLKNLRSLQIRSFLTDDDGRYFFQGLSTEIDYELQAELRKHRSSTKMLSRLDSKKDPEIDLKVDIGR
jgi:hypothetical protein